MVEKGTPFGFSITDTFTSGKNGEVVLTKKGSEIKVVKLSPNVLLRFSTKVAQLIGKTSQFQQAKYINRTIGTIKEYQKELLKEGNTLLEKAKAADSIIDDSNAKKSDRDNASREFVRLQEKVKQIAETFKAIGITTLDLDEILKRNEILKIGVAKPSKCPWPWIAKFKFFEKSHRMKQAIIFAEQRGIAADRAILDPQIAKFIADAKVIWPLAFDNIAIAESTKKDPAPVAVENTKQESTPTAVAEPIWVENVVPTIETKKDETKEKQIVQPDKTVNTIEVGSPAVSNVSNVDEVKTDPGKKEAPNEQTNIQSVVEEPVMSKPTAATKEKLIHIDAHDGTRIMELDGKKFVRNRNSEIAEYDKEKLDYYFERKEKDDKEITVAKSQTEKEEKPIVRYDDTVNTVVVKPDSLDEITDLNILRTMVREGQRIDVAQKNIMSEQESTIASKNSELGELKRENALLTDVLEKTKESASATINIAEGMVAICDKVSQHTADQTVVLDKSAEIKRIMPLS